MLPMLCSRKRSIGNKKGVAAGSGNQNKCGSFREIAYLVPRNLPGTSTYFRRYSRRRYRQRAPSSFCENNYQHREEKEEPHGASHRGNHVSRSDRTRENRIE